MMFSGLVAKGIPGPASERAGAFFSMKMSGM